MPDQTLAEISEHLAADVLTILGIPGTSVSGLFGNFLRAKVDESLGILLAELRAGNMSELQVASEVDTVSVCYRYLLAARDGAARRNMRLLATSMVGLAKRDRLVLELFRAKDLPVVVTMGGGYAKKVDDIVDIHLETIKIAAEFTCPTRPLA